MIRILYLSVGGHIVLDMDPTLDYLIILSNYWSLTYHRIVQASI